VDVDDPHGAKAEGLPGVTAADVRTAGAITAPIAASPSLLEGEEERMAVGGGDPTRTARGYWTLPTGEETCFPVAGSPVTLPQRASGASRGYRG
jgi:hypothetical protein